jgi:Zn-dependent protease
MAEIILFIFILIFSVVLHEYAHGYTAYIHGDDTAYLMGRLTLNPLKHVDLRLTILLPLVLYFLKMPVLAGAKGVPVNYYRLRNPKRDMAFVGAAGPLTNFALVAAAALVLKASVLFNLPLPSAAAYALFAVMRINLILAIFNLIPVPPLDGSRILAALLPARYETPYLRLERYGILIVLVLFMLGVFQRIIFPVYYNLLGFILALTGVGFYG